MLDKYQLIGEWHDGIDQCKKKLGRLINAPKNFQWPVQLASDDEIDSWLDRVYDSRLLISHKKLYQRIISNMGKCTDNDHFHYTWKIYQILEQYENCNHVSLDEYKKVGCSSDDLPKFTSDVSIALSLWPDDIRPESWVGSAWNCCVEALKIRRARWIESLDAEVTISA